MNIGFGAGSFLDGLVYDTFGTYRAALVGNAVLGALAVFAVLQVAGSRSEERGQRAAAPDVLNAAAAD